jgi:hypothetical protein
MTPAEHYREAERFLRQAESVGELAVRAGGDTVVDYGLLIQAAQVHATLATCFAQQPRPDLGPR